ncbi:L-aspartate oxidase [Clostridium sp. 'White wine YQ']|nr:L-aspartate oxidase [Clostridium sp. 'White wine YQ']MDD7794567.1 L-aspartate oxidase [Clostridium sp. 'White wine YQ']
MKLEKYTDVLIVGSGISGLYLALNLDEDINITIITKGKLNDTNSYLAQGGISTALSDEDIPLFINDTLKAGKYKNDLNAVEILARESMENILRLKTLGVPFDSTSEGFKFTREGAHSVNRIVHVKDSTGKSVQETLVTSVKKHKNITILEDATLLDIMVKNRCCVGGQVLIDENQISIHSKVVVLATGGIGGLFTNSTNQRALTGDSINIALKHKITLKDLKYIQIHPTALYDNNADSRRFLISEAVRGEGGKLLNPRGQRFINELLPRDVVSKAIFDEMKKFNVPNVFLDISFLDEDFIKNRFPAIYENCLNKGIDITKEPIPVSPAQHYFMGGIDVNTHSESSLKHLYAVGETSCTGVHGANRLASNSILEALVFSRRAAKSINSCICDIPIINMNIPLIDGNINTFIYENKVNTINLFKRSANNINVEFSYSR